MDDTNGRAVTPKDVYQKALEVLDRALDSDDPKVQLQAVNIALQRVDNDVLGDAEDVLWYKRAEKQYDKGLRRGHQAGVGAKGDD